MIRALILAALLSACAHATTPEPATPPAPQLPVTDAAGHRMEALTANGDLSCTADGAWCVRAEPGSAAILHNTAEIARLLLLTDNAVWPAIIRLSGDREALIGIAHTETQSYSGGGAHATALSLYRMPPTTRADSAVLNLPLEGAAFIRACFSEEEYKDRRRACADQYDFSAVLALDPANTGPTPRLIFTTEASTFPGRRSREEDSTLAPPLRERDIIRWRDESSSYTRSFSFDAANNTFVSTEELPLCSDYLQP